MRSVPDLKIVNIFNTIQRYNLVTNDTGKNTWAHLQNTLYSVTYYKLCYQMKLKTATLICGKIWQSSKILNNIEVNRNLRRCYSVHVFNAHTLDYFEIVCELIVLKILTEW